MTLLSTVHRGVAFEKRSLEILQYHLSMSLSKVGGKSDGGVDLQGWWWLPLAGKHSGLKRTPVLPTGKKGDTRQRIRVLGQCKAEAKKMGPNYVREMEGVLYRHSASSKQPVVALLVSQSAFTSSTILRAISSPIPFFLLHLPPPPENEERGSQEDDENNVKNGLGTAIWNPALSGENGLLGGKLEIRWERSLSLDSGRPGLWWKGKRLPSWIPPDTRLEAV